jgi:hypothetical protein
LGGGGIQQNQLSHALAVFVKGLLQQRGNLINSLFFI